MIRCLYGFDNRFEDEGSEIGMRKSVRVQVGEFREERRGS